MILTKSKILEAVKEGKIKISPYNVRNLGPASYDLSLGDRFRIYTGSKKIGVSEGVDYKKFSKLIRGKIKLNPGEFVLGITKEKISLSDDICAWLTGRSRFARLGLQIHSTAAFIQPGTSNKQVLEIYNFSKNILELKPGLKISQVIFEKTSGKAKYRGKFARQSL
ncbi:dCTP deaminase [Candidatus Woesearchaeota archaeon]|nr:dCTP deaminase [Candidatus Woesearchaeota archaeon]